VGNGSAAGVSLSPRPAETPHLWLELGQPRLYERGVEFAGLEGGEVPGHVGEDGGLQVVLEQACLAAGGAAYVALTACAERRAPPSVAG
jgi:hypothetical protein